MNALRAFKAKQAGRAAEQVRHATSEALDPRTERQLGEKIFIFNHKQKHHVVYSLTPTLKNARALKQIPFNGKKTVPAVIRKDLWTPFAEITFPADSKTTGLSVYRILREYARRHVVEWGDEIAKNEEGYWVNKKKRGRLLQDQRANTVADMAAVFARLEARPEAEAVAEGESEETTNRSIGLAGEGTGKRVEVLWSDILSAEFAETWTENVEHGVLPTELKPGRTQLGPEEKSEREEKRLRVQQQLQEEQQAWRLERDISSIELGLDRLQIWGDQQLPRPASSVDETSEDVQEIAKETMVDEHGKQDEVHEIPILEGRQHDKAGKVLQKMKDRGKDALLVKAREYEEFRRKLLVALRPLLPEDDNAPLEAALRKFNAAGLAGELDGDEKTPEQLLFQQVQKLGSRKVLARVLGSAKQHASMVEILKPYMGDIQNYLDEIQAEQAELSTRKRKISMMISLERLESAGSAGQLTGEEQSGQLALYKEIQEHGRPWIIARVQEDPEYGSSVTTTLASFQQQQRIKKRQLHEEFTRMLHRLSLIPIESLTDPRQIEARKMLDNVKIGKVVKKVLESKTGMEETRDVLRDFSDEVFPSKRRNKRSEERLARVQILREQLAQKNNAGTSAEIDELSKELQRLENRPGFKRVDLTIQEADSKDGLERGDEK